MKKQISELLKNAKNQRVAAIGMTLAMSPMAAMAQLSGLGGGAGFGATLTRATCLVMGASGPVVPFVAGVAVIAFFILLSLNEGNNLMSYAIKIMIGISGMVGVGWILNNLFGITFGC